MKRTQWVSRLALYRLGLMGHFKKNKWNINTYAVWLDSRQYKRFKRAQARIAISLNEKDFIERIV